MELSRHSSLFTLVFFLLCRVKDVFHQWQMNKEAAAAAAAAFQKMWAFREKCSIFRRGANPTFGENCWKKNKNHKQLLSFQSVLRQWSGCCLEVRRWFQWFSVVSLSSWLNLFTDIHQHKVKHHFKKAFYAKPYDKNHQPNRFCIFFAFFYSAELNLNCFSKFPTLTALMILIVYLFITKVSLLPRRLSDQLVFLGCKTITALHYTMHNT